MENRKLDMTLEEEDSVDYRDSIRILAARSVRGKTAVGTAAVFLSVITI
jgi:hypothetical protein